MGHLLMRGWTSETRLLSRREQQRYRNEKGGWCKPPFRN
jgi:hypothetical protein